MADLTPNMPNQATAKKSKKQAPQRKEWMFTIYQGHLTTESTTLDLWEADIRRSVPAGVNYLVFQQEACPSTGRHHVQGFVAMSQQKRPTALAKLFKVHHNCFQSTNEGTPAQNRGYCTDGDKRLPAHDFFEHGDLPGGRGKRTDLDDMCDAIKTQGLKRAIDAQPKVYLKYHGGSKALDKHYKRQRTEGVQRNVTVFVAWGTPGSGKSYWANHFDEDNSFPLPVQTRDTGPVWFDGYDGERTLLIEDFDPKTIPYRTLLRILDNYPLQVKVSGDFVPAEWDMVIITSNDSPNNWYTDTQDIWTDAFHSIPGPLERRIESIAAYTGTWPNTSITVDNLPPVQELPTRAQLKEPEETTAEAPVQAEDPTQNASSQATPDGLPSTSGHSPTSPDHTLIDDRIQELKDQVDTAEDWDWLDTLLDPQTLPSTQHYPMPAHWIDDEAQEQ